MFLSSLSSAEEVKVELKLRYESLPSAHRPLTPQTRREAMVRAAVSATRIANSKIATGDANVDGLDLNSTFAALQ